jgi:hypothetical protein
MRKLLIHSLIVALSFGLATSNAMAAAAASSATVAIRGTATGADGLPLDCGTVRLRSLDTGAIVDDAVIGSDGSFELTATSAGNLLVEAVDPANRLVGSAAARTTSVDLRIPALSCARTQMSATAAVQEPAASGGGGLSAGAITAIVIGSAAAIGIATWAIVRDDASPSQ